MISDALPIQFWDADDETFNEKEICGINPQCFCLPVECDDIISQQFTEDYGGFDLGIYSESGLIDLIPLVEVSSGVWGFTFSFSDYSGFCDQQVQLKIVAQDPALGALSTFTNVGSGTNWTTGANPSFNITGVFGQTKFLHAPFIGVEGATYEFNYNIDVVDAGAILQDVTIYLLDSTYAGVGSQGLGATGGGNFTGTASITPTGQVAYVAIGALLDDSGVGSAQGDINSFSYVAQGDVIVKKSDCLDVKESHDCTKLIEYSNESDFDGIVYSDISPRPVFYLRIPAILFEEDNPQEQEDLVLSNGVIVTLRQEIQEKRLLETGYMPNYMHKKLQKVLMHESITIDGDGWKRRDAYEPNPIKKYALKRASVLLTKYNSVLKNTI